uniref:RRM domain-containing protein n=1 Tax=Oryzias latipes TaxID=8090 RepID=A0A3P9HNQ4_ORYLA
MLSHMCLSVNKKAVPKKEVLLCGVPKSLKLVLSRDCELSHGLYVTGLSSYMNEGYIKAYFQQWGNVISCKIKKIPNCGKNIAAALVKYSSEDEADEANWSGPHVIGGLEVEVKQFVCQKVGKKNQWQKILTNHQGGLILIATLSLAHIELCFAD